MPVSALKLKAVLVLCKAYRGKVELESMSVALALKTIVFTGEFL